ncbi:MAG: hypothetical protein V2I54_06025 [Bacteroidales bacterium]|jgi:antitoxin component YwqK of YwqJK toxin-antitoxin module|nr:hypothetical protein [Bacteroidales bacterium]
MRNSLLFSTLFLFVVFSCNTGTQPKNDEKRPVSENEARIKKAYYDNGTLKSEITIKNKRKNGPAKKYYTTGELHTLVHYVNNIKEGEAVWYYKNGQPYRITPYKNNRIHGVRKMFYDDGILMAEVPYQMGIPQPGLKEYNKNGELLTNYPELVFSARDLIAEENLYILQCRLSNRSPRVKFYQKVKGTDGKERLVELPAKNGVVSLEFHVPARIRDTKTITIYARMKSTLGNPYITKSSYTFSLDTY